MRKKLLIGISILVIIWLFYKIFFSPTVKNTFPFSKADKIELIFYKEAQSSSDLKKFSTIPIKKKVKLNENDKEEIFEILYKENCIFQFDAACYFPRHAIVFTTQNDTIGIIEMCTECTKIMATKGIKVPKMSDGMAEKLNHYFESITAANSRFAQ